MKLIEYLKLERYTSTYFAKLCDVSKQQFSNWTKGKTMPRKETILKIQELTKGKVKPKDWFTE